MIDQNELDKLDEMYINTRLADADRQTKALYRGAVASIRLLCEKIGELESCLNMAVRYYSAEKFSNVFQMGWSKDECHKIGRAMSIYCRKNSYIIKDSNANGKQEKVKTYPISAWEDFLAGKA